MTAKKSRSLEGSEPSGVQKKVNLTDEGIRKLKDAQPSERYQDKSKKEIIEKVYKLERRVNRLENQFKHFRGKVMERYGG